MQFVLDLSRNGCQSYPVFSLCLASVSITGTRSWLGSGPCLPLCLQHWLHRWTAILPCADRRLGDCKRRSVSASLQADARHGTDQLDVSVLQRQHHRATDGRFCCAGVEGCMLAGMPPLTAPVQYGPLAIKVDADPWNGYTSGIIRYHCSPIQTSGDVSGGWPEERSA